MNGQDPTKLTSTIGNPIAQYRGNGFMRRAALPSRGPELIEKLDFFVLEAMCDGRHGVHAAAPVV